MSDEAPAHLQSLDLSGPPTKRAKVDKIDIADKVVVRPSPCNSRKLSWSSLPQTSSDASLRCPHPAARRPRREKILKRSIASRTSMRRVTQQRCESLSKYARFCDARFSMRTRGVLLYDLRNRLTCCLPLSTRQCNN